MDSSRFVVMLRRRIPLAHILLLVGILATAASCSGDGDASPPPETTGNESCAVPPRDDVPTGGGSDPEVGIEISDAIPAEGDLSDETLTAKPPDAESSTAGASTASFAAVSGVDLVYFHTAEACDCMAAMGDVIESSLNEYFPEAIEEGTVRFHSITSDDPANAYHVRMYGSQAFDLFLVTYVEGVARATPIYEIWNLMGDDEAVGLAVKARVADGLARSAEPV